jgi:hypothetical protein
MKTLTINSATKKLTTLTVASLSNPLPLSKTSMAYKFAKQVIEGAKTIRPCYTLGRGRFTSNQDHTTTTTLVLSKIGIEFTLTNDAPRGSATGNLITIKTKIK